MKNKKIAVNLLFILGLIAANKTQAQENMKWPELDSFHATAMSSFHAAEANKLRPLRDSAASILAKSKALQASQVPSGYNATVLKPLLQQLTNECKSVNDAVVGKKSDSNLRPLAMKAHNTFHEILSKEK